jgi:hypothetical protein
MDIEAQEVEQSNINFSEPTPFVDGIEKAEEIDFKENEKNAEITTRNKKVISLEYKRTVLKLAREAKKLLDDAYDDQANAPTLCLALGTCFCLITFPVGLILVILYKPFEALDRIFGCSECLKWFYGVPIQCLTSTTSIINQPKIVTHIKRAKALRGDALGLIKNDVVDYTFVIPQNEFVKLKSFPKFEQALESGVIKKIAISQIIPQGFGLSNCQFVSHKWQGLNPDVDSAVFNLVKMQPPKPFVWFDYTCVPQDNAEARFPFLLSIPVLMQRCKVDPFHPSEELKEAYMHSIWCQLEAMGAYVEGQERKITNWTIYDPSDLYGVLPGFIAMVFSSSYRMSFLSMQEPNRNELFVQILKFFINFSSNELFPNGIRKF